jgi:hypothetical protein
MALLAIATAIRITGMSEERNNILGSLLMALLVILIEARNAPRPAMRQIFITLEPKISPMVISVFCERVAIRAIESSGKEVDTESRIKPIASWPSPVILDILTEEAMTRWVSLIRARVDRVKIIDCVNSSIIII